METENKKKASADFIKQNRRRLGRLANIRHAMHLRKRGVPFPYGEAYILVGFGTLFAAFQWGASLVILGWLAAVCLVAVIFLAWRFSWDDYLYRAFSKYDPADTKAFASFGERVFHEGLNATLIEDWIEIESSRVRDNISTERAKYAALFKRSKQREKFLEKMLAYIDRLKQPSSGDR